LGSIAGSWDVASNWQDVTAGEDPALAAPGANDDVSITASSGVTDVITGTGNAAALTPSGSIVLSGQFAAASISSNTYWTLLLNSGDTLSVSGEIDATQGDIALSGGALTAGNLTLGYGHQLSVEGGTQTLGSLTTNQSTIDVYGGGTLSIVGNVEDNSSLYEINGGSFTVGGTLTNENGFIEIFSQQGSTVQLANANLSDVAFYDNDTSSIEIGTAGNAAAGSVTIDTGLTTSLTGSLSAQGGVVVNGTLIDTSSLGLAGGPLSGSGQLQIDSGATLYLGAVAANSDNTIDFAGTGGILNISPASLDAGVLVPSIEGVRGGGIVGHGAAA
jgi:filamentous hemagglutinin